MPEEEIQRVLEARAPRAEAPELLPENVDYLHAFFDLSKSRTPGAMGGLWYIPVSEIGAYWDRVEFPGDFPMFLRMIGAADEAFMAWEQERQKRERANNKR